MQACFSFPEVLHERRFMVRPKQKRLSRRVPDLFAAYSVGVRMRIASLLVILSVFVAFGTRLSHMLLVQHAICEHGYLVDERQATAHHEKVRDLDPADHAKDGDANNKDDHDHCDVMSVLHHSNGSLVIPNVTTLCWFELPGIQEARESQPIDAITLAPKGSPPAVYSV